jgi:CheY-like chemotaxis protein
MSSSVSRPRRVLVVDDNVDGLRIVTIMLRSWGHIVETCHESDLAVTVALNFLPEIVMLDLGMPRVSGLEVAKMMKNTPGLENVRLIAVTGYGQTEDFKQTRQAGFEHHLVKPIDFEVLRHVLATPAIPK